MQTNPTSRNMVASATLCFRSLKEILFLGAPYSDYRSNADYSPSQASCGLFQLLETHVRTGSPYVSSPLAGVSLSAAQLTAQHTAPKLSFRDHLGVSTHGLTDPPWTRVQKVDSVVYEQGRFEDVAAAFNACMPQALNPFVAVPALGKSLLHTTVAQLLNALLEPHARSLVL
ncbi:hypothetical protein HPB51_022820 [Rhipicephalus microplus]|uniref:Uncharacterized protein n=1 Tax=Rhipicephalus microplus TaxID=6941 RepID=A0A9J6DCQ5_RHIMP|nr:hypothetical protein HPB51_022820 [Rhipicephalus microplus]